MSSVRRKSASRVSAQDIVGPGESFRSELPGQFRDRVALAEDHGVLQHLAAIEHGEHRDRVGALRDLVLAGLEAPHVAAREGQQGEPDGTPDHSGLVQDPRHIEESPMGWDLDDPRPGSESVGRGQDPPGLKAQEEQAPGHEDGDKACWLRDRGGRRRRTSSRENGVAPSQA